MYIVDGIIAKRKICSIYVYHHDDIDEQVKNKTQYQVDDNRF